MPLGSRIHFLLHTMRSQTPSRSSTPVSSLGHIRQPSTSELVRSRARPAHMTSRIAWLASLDVEEEPHHHRKTGIICTIGSPSVCDLRVLLIW